MDSPLVSVVLPVHNRGDVVAEALSSVLNQTYNAIEVIVVDDGCTDTSMDEVCRVADARVRIVHNDGPHSASGARNCGIAHATGRYLAFQDSDDRWHQEKLDRQMRFLTDPSHSAVAVVGCRWTIMRQGLGLRDVTPLSGVEYFGRDDVLDGVEFRVLGTPMLLVDRERCAGALQFDTLFPSLEERDLVYRLLPPGAGTLAILKDELVDVRRGRNDHVANPAGALIGFERFLSKYATELSSRPSTIDWYHYRAMREALILRQFRCARAHYRAIGRREIRLTVEYRLGQLLGYYGLTIVTRLRLTPSLAQPHSA